MACDENRTCFRRDSVRIRGSCDSTTVGKCGGREPVTVTKFFFPAVEIELFSQPLSRRAHVRQEMHCEISRDPGGTFFKQDGRCCRELPVGNT